jgi:hypothetical protein
LEYSTGLIFFGENVPEVQTVLLAGDPILNEIKAVAALKQTVTKFHNDPHG